jgi:hypothetical protein
METCACASRFGVILYYHLKLPTALTTNCFQTTIYRQPHEWIHPLVLPSNCNSSWTALTNCAKTSTDSRTNEWNHPLALRMESSPNDRLESSCTTVRSNGDGRMRKSRWSNTLSFETYITHQLCQTKIAKKPYGPETDKWLPSVTYEIMKKVKKIGTHVSCMGEKKANTFKLDMEIGNSKFLIHFGDEHE